MYLDAEEEVYQPQHIEMSDEQRAALEREKRELAAALKDMPRGERRISGEGSALDPEPEPSRVVSIRERLAAQRKERGEPEPVHSWPAREQRRPLNVDPEKLAQLVAAAQETDSEAATAEEMAESARAAADRARRELDAYLEETGLTS